MAITKNSNNQWQVSPNLDSDKTLYTAGTIVDSDILVKSAKSVAGTGSATTPTASGASTSTSLSGTTLTVARSVTPTVVAGYVSSGTAGTVTITGTVPTEEKTVTPSTSSQTINPTTGKLISKITVNATSADTAKSVLGNATLGNATSIPTGYSEDTTVIIPSQGYLKINEGYIGNTVISLDQMLDGKADTAGTAESNLLTGKIAYDVDGKKLTGTMTNNGAVSQTLNTSTTSYTIPAGYHNGSGTVSITTQEKTVTSSSSAQTVTPDSGKVLSKVTVNAMAAATFANVGTSTTDQSSTSGYIPLVNAAGYTAQRWMNSLTVPASKTLSTVSLTAGTSSTRTYLSTMNVPGYTTVSKINLGGILSEISLQGGYAYLKSNDATAASLVYIDAYNDASTPALTGNKLVVQNNKWVKTSLSATSATGNYYGWISFTKPADLTVTTSVTADGMSTYFDTGTSIDKSVTITPKYTNTVGYKVALTTATNNGGTAYYKIKTTSGSKSGGTVSWGTGWITQGSSTVTASDLGLSTWSPSSTYFQTSTTGAVSAAKYTKNQYNTSDYYVIAGTAGAITGGGLTHGNVTTNDTTYLTDTNTGFAVTFSNVASRAAASYSITKNGWISAAGTGLSATGDDTKSLTKYIKAATFTKTYSNNVLTLQQNTAGWITEGTISVSKNTDTNYTLKIGG